MSTKKAAPADTETPPAEAAGSSLAETGLPEPSVNPASEASEDAAPLSQLDHDGDGRPGGSLSHAEQIKRLENDLAVANELLDAAQTATAEATARAETAEAGLADAKGRVTELEGLLQTVRKEREEAADQIGDERRRADEAEGKLRDIEEATRASSLAPAVSAIVGRESASPTGGAVFVFRQGQGRPVSVAETAAAMKVEEEAIREAVEADPTLTLDEDKIDLAR